MKERTDCFIAVLYLQFVYGWRPYAYARYKIEVMSHLRAVCMKSSVPMPC